MSDSDESGVTYTEVSSPFEGLSDIGSPRADDHEYLELPLLGLDQHCEKLKIGLKTPPTIVDSLIEELVFAKKKFQALKASVKAWCKEDNQRSSAARLSIQSRLTELEINLDPQMFKRLSDDQKDNLESNVTYEEIKKAVWDCGTNKSPGPDGFTFDFIRRYWKIMDQDMVNVVRELFISGKFPPGCNSSFITLIPKKQDAKVVKDFRRITLIGCIYKIIAKIMANRLSLVILDLISDVHFAFVANRQILDGPFILNELLSWCKFHKTKAMIFKVDFEKDFDSGDPLSPFLFILVMESLHLSFSNILNVGLLKGIRIDDSLSLSPLFYANDVVFIGKWEKSNFTTIVHMLKCFFLASGLKINIHKSKLMGIGISQEEVTMVANLIGCTTLSMPFNYLGVKVGISSSRSKSWDDVLAKISYRVSKWKIKTLSIGGRYTLTKSVLSLCFLKYVDLIIVSYGFLIISESIRRKFFNGIDKDEKKMSMIGWNKILASKKKGGLGVSSFFALNRALLLKWIWRFLSHGSSLWSRFIKAMYGDRGSLDNSGLVPRHSLWNSIIREFDNLSLKCINLLKRMKKKVAVKFNDTSLIDSFRRPPRGGIEEEQPLNLVDNVAPFFLPTVGAPTRWVKVVPIKINIFAWKVSLDKLPSRFNLSLRGIDIPSIICPICSSAGESCSHLIFSCNLARLILRKVARWWELDIPDFHSYEDWLAWLISLRIFKGLNNVLEGVFYVMWWVI
ncbi:RNA-directed DNA polymerase, eukaryota [Tanacetum coccineum]